MNDRRNIEKGYLQTTKYLNNSLNQNEQILYRAHLSWIPLFVRQIPFMLIGGIVGGVFAGISNNLLFGLLLFMGICFIGVLSQIPAILKNIGTDILLTNQGLHTKRGIIVVKDDRFSKLNMIDNSDIDYNSIFGRIFKYGNVEIRTISGGADALYGFKNLARPATFKNSVRAAQQRFMEDIPMNQNPRMMNNAAGDRVHNNGDNNNNRGKLSKNPQNNRKQGGRR